jgi:hypothetical protein
MAAPKNPQDCDAGDERRNMLEGGKKSRDVVRHPFGRDHHHGHGKSESRVDKSLEPCHLDSAETATIEPRQFIEICRNCRRYFFVSHASAPAHDPDDLF